MTLAAATDVFVKEVTCIEVEGISHTAHRKCSLSSYKGLPFFPRNIADLSIRDSRIKHDAMIANLRKWAGDTETCYCVKAMEGLLKNMHAWLWIASTDHALCNLEQVKLACAVYDKLVDKDFDNWSHFQSCLTHQAIVDDLDRAGELEDEHCDPFYNYGGFGPINRDFAWNAKKKTISWVNTYTRETETVRVPQMQDAMKLMAGMDGDDFRQTWIQKRHAHELHHQQHGTVCDAWVDGPQTFHHTENTASERTLILYTHVAKKGFCAKCPPRRAKATGHHCANYSRHKVAKRARNTRPAGITIRTKVKVSGELGRKKEWGVQEKEKLWEVMKAHVGRVAGDQTRFNNRSTVAGNVSIKSGFDRAAGYQPSEEEMAGLLHAHRVGLCYETNAEIREPREVFWERLDAEAESQSETEVERDSDMEMESDSDTDMESEGETEMESPRVDPDL
ncbi:hypothetical protein CTA2_12373 [Colletotrichum tanaceti]|uniref:Uncharacterized protein n=1 Tax=Colletotrichum tanaceti TaxID=1306861 RepID=A0A4U6WZE6_9PEZI|nr:hypothetical protein CTA2_12373 [Colletotrichum tanaceti]TKW48470.1 hypothetical protein CTA1_4281 [Colletotrichum tanaceti]